MSTINIKRCLKKKANTIIETLLAIKTGVRAKAIFTRPISTIDTLKPFVQ